jgi:hypothetical protein
MVALAENARIPVDNPPRTRSPAVHDAGSLNIPCHLAMIEFGAFLKLLLYISLIASIPTLKIAVPVPALVLRHRRCSHPVKLAALAFLALTRTATAKCGSFAFTILGAPSCWVCLAPPPVRVKGLVQTHSSTSTSRMRCRRGRPDQLHGCCTRGPLPAAQRVCAAPWCWRFPSPGRPSSERTTLLTAAIALIFA